MRAFQNPGHLIRRNGKAQSCEPCRKSKVRCDHTYPTCRRCRARNEESLCIYHPAPMTKRRNQKSVDETDRSRDLDTSYEMRANIDDVPLQRDTGPGRRRGKNNITSPQLKLHESKVDDVPSLQAGEDAVVEDDRAGAGFQSFATEAPEYASTLPREFLGSTSYPSVFSHSWKTGAAGSSRHWQAPLYSDDEQNAGPMELDPDHVKLGIKMLQQFDSVTFIKEILESLFKARQFVFVPRSFIFKSLASIRDTLKASKKQYQELSEAIFINTFRKVSFSDPSKIHWHELCTGKQLRWEIIGIIFTLLAHASKHSSAHKAQLLSYDSQVLDKQEFTRKMFKASDLCLTFCDQNEHVNDLLAWYQFESCLLQTDFHGDASNQAWRRLGDLATTIYSSGMHQDIDTDENVSFYFRESRKKCFAASYKLDKSIATLLGRPPRITSQYATQSLPLDLSDEETLAEGTALTANMANLDGAGWNTDGVVRPSSWIRARGLMATIMEEILQLSLGNINLDLKDCAISTLDRLQTVWDAIPLLMKYEDSCWDTQRSANECHILLVVHLDYLYSKFLLQRIISKHTQKDSTELYDTAWALLSMTLTLCQRRDNLMEVQHALSWTVLYKGLPSAGILAVELLRKQQQSYESCLQVPRGELIRSLSVFNNMLDWVARPGHANYSLCAAARKVLTNILDAILDADSYGRGHNTSSEAAPSNSRTVDGFSEKLSLLESELTVPGSFNLDAWGTF